MGEEPRLVELPKFTQVASPLLTNFFLPQRHRKNRRVRTDSQADTGGRWTNMQTDVQTDRLKDTLRNMKDKRTERQTDRQVFHFNFLLARFSLS